MTNIFSGSEVVNLAIQIEKNGRDFYNVMSGRSKNPRVKEIFRFLEGEEEKHISVFQKMLDNISVNQPVESFPGEYSSYVDSLANEHVFTKDQKGKEAAENAKSDKEAVALGIGFEKDSIVFYDGIKKVVPEYDHKIIDSVIAQEQGHLKQLTDLSQVI